MDTPSKKGLKWTAEAERDLYAACLVAVGEPKGETLRKAVGILKENLDIDITVKAASHRVQHLQKLKRKEGGAAEVGSAKKTPASASRGKKRAKAVAAGEDDDDHEDMEETPSKKPARGKKVAAAAPIDQDEVRLKLVKNEDYVGDSDKDAV